MSFYFENRSVFSPKVVSLGKKPKSSLQDLKVSQKTEVLISLPENRLWKGK
jgi:hypothetical protein